MSCASDAESELLLRRVGSPPVVRLGGLPAAALAELHFDDTYLALDEVRRLDHELSRTALRLTDDLHEIVGALGEGHADKPALIGLRRAIHNGRIPGPREWNDRIRALVPIGSAAAVVDWLEGRNDRDRAFGELSETLDREFQQKTEALRKVCAEFDFRSGVAVSSPSLSEELERWLAEPDRHPRRAKISRLVKYVDRAAAKTSLFSSLGVVGLAAWCDDARAHYSSRVGIVTDLDERIIDQFVDALTAQPQLREHAVVTADPSARIEDSKVVFLCCDRKDFAESIRSMRAGPAVRACLRLLSATAMTIGDLTTEMVGVTGHDRETVARYLDKLIGTGLLTVVSPASDTAANPAAALLDWLIGQPVDPGLTDDLAQLAALIDEPAARPDIAQQRSRHAELQATIERLERRLDLPAVDPRGAHFPFHETGVLLEPVVVSSGAEWQRPLADLALIRQLVRLLDPTVMMEAAATETFLAHYGPNARVPFLDFHRSVSQAMGPTGDSDAFARIAAALRGSPQEWAGQSAAWRQPRLMRLQEIRARFCAVLGAPVGDDGIVRIAAESIAGLVDELSTLVRPARSSACYVQPRQDGDRMELVLNELHSGFGRNRSRIHHLIARAGGAPAEMVTETMDENEEVLAELGGTFGVAFNRRTMIAPVVIHCPGSRPGPAGRLPLSDLVVVYDAADDRVELRSTALDRRVLPVHNGMMAAPMLPPSAATLTFVFGGNHMIRMSALSTAESLRGHPLRVGDARKFSRVVVGSVVVFRACWVVDGDRIPRPGKGETEAGFLLRLRDWVAGNDIPERTFVRVGPNALDIWMKNRKPIFLDLRNVFATSDFVRRLPDGAEIVFEEALPDPVDVGTADSDARVAEYIIELNTGMSAS
ncbi:lantibiotic dehydratase [Nocardia sp. NPDC058480]|uniref:lantibiotic dehydratase n=1 Tax=unclassified Nocardia TaxID=2637762 RepID=UPI0036482F39